MRLAADLRLGDRYVLEERIAVGGMGEVWRGRDEVLGRLVAVKVLREDLGQDTQLRQRFRDEARHTAALSHPGIAGVFDYGESRDATPYLVMELVDGEPLSALLAREGTLSAQRTLDVVGQAALALQAAHEAGVVHRDVKPGNLLVRPDGVVKVTDFGIARAVDAAPLTRTGLVMGTAQYLSPEQAAGRPGTAASDVYALGVVAYECLAGRPLFVGDGPVAVALAHVNAEPPALPASVPIPVRDLVMRTLEKDPARRPSSAGELGRSALALRLALTEGAPLPDPPVYPRHGAAGPPAPVDTLVLTGLTPLGEPSAAQSRTDVRGMPDPLPAHRGEPGRRRARNGLLAAGLLVVLLGAVLLRACAAGPAYVTVPALRGTSLAQASSRMRALDLTLASRVVHDATHPAGTVLTQDPAPGDRRPQGSRVTVTVASGPRRITIDPAAYRGQPYAQVRDSLTGLGLSVARVDQPSDAVADTVLDVAPAGTVTEGTTVTVVVAVPLPLPPAGGDRPGKGKGHRHG